MYRRQVRRNRGFLQAATTATVNRGLDQDYTANRAYIANVVWLQPAAMLTAPVLSFIVCLDAWIAAHNLDRGLLDGA